MKALIVSRIDNEAALEFAEKIKKILESEGCAVAYDQDTGACSSHYR